MAECQKVHFGLYMACAIGVILLGEEAVANPVVATTTEYGILAYDENLTRNLLAVSGIALSLEYLVFRRCFQRYLVWRKALPYYIGIHTISWPLTQVASVGLGLFTFAIFPVTELVPISLETFMVRRILRFRSRKGKGYVLKSMVICNLVSFAVGWILLAWLGYHVFQG